MTRMPTGPGLALCLLVFFACMGLLLTGSSLLTVALSERLGLPWGTPITWLGMVALVFALWFGSAALRAPRTHADRNYRRAWAVLLAMAVLWPFVSYALAGNWSYSFGQREGFQGSSAAADWFFRYSFSVLLLPLLFVFVRSMHRLLAGRSSPRSGP